VRYIYWFNNYCNYVFYFAENSEHKFCKGFSAEAFCRAVLLGGIDCIKIKARHRNGLLLQSGFYYVV